MNHYQFYKLENGGIYLEHSSCMFPVELERKINELAEEKITRHGPSLGGFFGGFVVSFHIAPKYTDMFLKEIVPRLFTESNGKYVVTNELAESNDI